MAIPTRFGPEFRVNTITSGNQDSASVAALANGKFVVVWEDDSGGNNDVRGQIYNADGSTLGAESVFGSGLGDQQQPAVAGTGDNRFVVVWENRNTTPLFSSPTIKARVMNADGSSPAGAYAGELLVNSDITRTATEPAVAAFASPANGRFLMSWSALNSFGDTDIFARAYNAAGAFSTEAIAVDTAVPDERQSAVAGLGNGNYVVVWTDIGVTNHTDGSGSHIRARIYAGNGAEIGGSFIINSFPPGNQTAPVIAALSDGGFAVAFASELTPTNRNIHARSFNADGSERFAGDFPIADTGADETQPAIAANDSGFLIAWKDAGPGDGSGSLIRAMFFDDSDLSDGPFTVNTVAAGDQSEPSVAGLKDGRFVITWTDPGLDPAQTDASGNSVRAQIFDPRTKAVNLVGTIFGDDWVGTGFGDTMIGQTGDDTLAGAAGADTLGGGDGNDTLFGDAGADALYGNVGDDIINGDGEDDTAVGAEGKDTIAGGTGRDFLFGAGFSPDGSFAAGSGDDTLNGGDGDDGLWGGDGADIMNGDAGHDGMAGGAGNDAMNGGEGNDFLFGGDFSIADGSRLANSGDDTLNGGAGNDALYGFDGIDTINGDAGNDYVEAGEDNDAINGGADSDTLLGQDGADTLNGGTGFDYLYGGAGADIFSFRKSDSYDTAWDFSAAQGDKLRLDPTLGVTNFAQFQARLTGFTFEGVSYSRINFAALGSNDEITIGGIAHTAWTAAMVEFA